MGRSGAGPRADPDEVLGTECTSPSGQESVARSGPNGQLAKLSTGRWAPHVSRDWESQHEPTGVLRCSPLGLCPYETDGGEHYETVQIRWERPDSLRRAYHRHRLECRQPLEALYEHARPRRNEDIARLDLRNRDIRLHLLPQADGVRGPGHQPAATDIDQDRCLFLGKGLRAQRVRQELVIVFEILDRAHRRRLWTWLFAEDGRDLFEHEAADVCRHALGKRL